MFLRLVYDDSLAQAAYLIGCQATGEAIIVDPERDIDRYLALAASEKLKIVAATETHVHADFLSGVREFAEKTGAEALLSAEGGPEWQYTWLNKKQSGGTYRHRLLRHGDQFDVGKIRFRVIHTPGHTPEHICFEVTDRGGSANEPMGLLTGDFVFVGDLGRPDLLETAAGQQGTMEPSARRLYSSVRAMDALPDYMQVWPGHGAGSACGKALGAVPQSTIGYEKRFNPAVRAATSEADFVKFILSGQPDPPPYFARMKKENLHGPAILGSLPRPERWNAADVGALTKDGGVLIDTRPWAEFRGGHLPGSISAVFDKSFVSVAGSYVKPEQRIGLVVDERNLDAAVRGLVRVGLDRVVAWVSPADLAKAKLVSSKEIDVEAAKKLVKSGSANLLDVRSAREFAEGHIPGAKNVTHLQVESRLAEVPQGRPILINCRSGVRSARATALLESKGFDVTNLAGGFLAWEAAGGEVER